MTLTKEECATSLLFLFRVRLPSAKFKEEVSALLNHYDLRKLKELKPILELIEKEGLSFQYAADVQRIIKGNLIQLDVVDDNRCSMPIDRSIVDNGWLNHSKDISPQYQIYFVSFSSHLSVKGSATVFYLSLYENKRWRWRLSNKYFLDKDSYEILKNEVSSLI